MVPNPSRALNWTDKNLLDLEDPSILALDPKTTTHATVRDSRVTKKEKLKWKRNIEVDPKALAGNFLNNTGHILNYQSAVTEAKRCLKCVDAPCQKSCPTSIDVRAFIGSIATGNIYGAAKQLLSDNPLALSCGDVCPVSELCEGSCNLAKMEGASGAEVGAGLGKGAINIHGLQAYAVDTFRKMNVPQIRDPSLPLDNLPQSYSAKIALVGAGPSSVSCATFLARLGYTDVTIFEKQAFSGGLSSLEIPQTRLPFETIEFETRLALDLGVKFQYNKEFGKDISVESLRKDGYKAIYLAFGLPDAKRTKLFANLTDGKDGFYTSKTFLPLVTGASKTASACACKSEKPQLPKLYGKVVILGCGDTAFDVASSAVRCGAENVVVVFRRGFSGIRAVPEEYEIALKEKVDVMPNSLPKEIFTRDGRISGIELYLTDVVNGKVVVDEDQFTRLKCDFVISAFGSTVSSEKIINAAQPVKFNEWGNISVNEEMRTNERDIFAGGDLTGNGLTVEATNDGKTASWYIHKYIQDELYKQPVPEQPQLPKFYSPIDLVDLSVEVCGMKFKNPFGFASAPPATTCEMIARGFQAGWGFAVTKTFSMDRDIVTNVAPRIIGGCTSGTKEDGPNHTSYLNIELISEKSASYWCNGIRQLKQRYPDHVVIASIMAPFNKEDWQTLAVRCEESNADAIEINLSCPHGMGERKMALFIGQCPDLITETCKWIKEVCNIPLFVKLTPNITDITEIAEAAIKGGADGCTATNTVSGLMSLNRKGEAWPRIGEKKLTTYGGMSGNAIRPIALRAVSAIHKKFPHFPILATGGVDSAEAALQFIHAGASVCQVSSAVQNQSMAIIEDFITGLKTLLFMNGHPEYDDWESQLAPEPDRERLVGRGLPKFGKYLLERRELQAKDIMENGILTKKETFKIPDVKINLSNVPSIKDSIGKAVSRIGAWGAMDPEAKEHVVAVIDPEVCVNCGLCYSICSDGGYTSIEMDPNTHVPVVNDNCTGCTLCTVCPARAISMVPRSSLGKPPYQPSRGIEPGEFSEPIRFDV
uniref:dihydropyrimidine dehydrogenase (NADP(+)) n=1 Tax=Percolomonas cosmopolitus TaxID=63605 RepID=A0A7S1KR95_9EUKA|mmetsp:Transcript_5894/g.22361  ORF Transcript_5894/g.22361 Transcript_5894/m.22361 type:complete len:1046 (+) Transcript_5894:146-3283(+)